jgi:hypothetical protein
MAMRRSTSKEVKLDYTADAGASYRRRVFANSDSGIEDGGFSALPQPPVRRSENERAAEAEAPVGGDWDGLNVRAGFSSSSKMHSRHVTGRGLHNKIGQSDKQGLNYGDDVSPYGDGDSDWGLRAVEDKPGATGSRRSAPNLGPKPRAAGTVDGHYVRRSKR